MKNHIKRLVNKDNILPLILPILVALFPPLFIYAQNIQRLQLSNVVIPTVMTVSCSLFLFFLINLGIKSVYKSSLISSIAVFIILSYGYFFDFIRTTPINGIVQGKQTPGIIFALFIMSVSTYFILKKEDGLKKIIKLAICIAVILLVPSVLEIVRFDILYTVTSQKIIQNDTWKSSKIKDGYTPDIYYLVFDRYGRSDTLKNEYQFDNVEFVQFLEEKGFVVLSRSWANYTQTQLSLSSSLNMKYHNDLVRLLGSSSTDVRPLHELIENNDLIRFFKNNGYKYIHSGSWWGPTAWNRFADENINVPSLSEYSEILFSRTIFHPIVVKLNMPIFNSRLTHCQRSYFKFDEIEKVPDIKEPTFTFAHFLTTHEPYVFDKNGNCLSLEEVDEKTESENYSEQITFVNKKIKKLVSTILEKSKDNPPIIIIQGDEGPYPDSYKLDDENYNWKNASEEEKRQKMAILNAYYLPKDGNKLTYIQITPVNTFRLILKHYFGQNIEQLPNTVYFSNKSKPYNFTVITERDSQEF